jgi:hypothetical protein
MKGEGRLNAYPTNFMTGNVETIYRTMGKQGRLTWVGNDVVGSVLNPQMVL